ncbi:MAG: NAD(+) synthase [Pseudomonadota bacterium]
MAAKGIADHIVTWLCDYVEASGLDGFVVGVSGGIDSAVTSTLCAHTGKPVLAVTMPIHQDPDQVTLADEHLAWLDARFDNVETRTIPLTPVFEALEAHLPSDAQDTLTMANTRSRLRMLTLYACAGGHRRLVAGTGNKVEDFGVGFYTKYGDGGVDLSPIADLMKSEVYAVAAELGVIDGIQQAAPTDGLWDDGRTDEGQIGASYDELEWAMAFDGDEAALSARQREVLAIYRRFHAANKHKMLPIPVCEIPGALRG